MHTPAGRWASDAFLSALLRNEPVRAVLASLQGGVDEKDRPAGRWAPGGTPRMAAAFIFPIVQVPRGARGRFPLLTQWRYVKNPLSDDDFLSKSAALLFNVWTSGACSPWRSDSRRVVFPPQPARLSFCHPFPAEEPLSVPGAQLPGGTETAFSGCGLRGPGDTLTAWLNLGK